jgi:hypothetical protein
MSWFRLHTCTLNDPKVQRLPGETFKGWVNLLCLAKENNGTLPNVASISFALRMTLRQATQLIETLTESGLIDQTETGLCPHNWGQRQYISDVSTDRVKRYRKRHETVSPTVSETPPETEQRQNRTEQKEVGAKAPSRTRHQIPKDWVPVANHFSQAAKLGFGARDVETMAEDMRIWAGANGSLKKDWDLTFSGWMRRQTEPGFRKNGHKPLGNGAGVKAPLQFKPEAKEIVKPPPEDRERQLQRLLKARAM